MITPIKSSKTITIEAVANGWIVRPYPDFNQYRGECGTCYPPEEVFCFTRVEDLQATLPRLLGCPAKPAEEPPVCDPNYGAPRIIT